MTSRRPNGPRGGRGRRPTVDRRGFLRSIGFVGLGVAAGAGGAAAASALAGPVSGSAAAPAADSIDVGFCREMSLHHEQALAMCQRVLGSDTGGSVQAAAAEILQNQSFERGLMLAWLETWGQSTAPPETVMAWMGMAVPASEMPGLASDSEMTELAVLAGPAKGRRFLELMRAHHVGGVHMAGAALGAETAQVRRAATQMASTQAYEIEQFDVLLATTYAAT
ncbi:DUF305 domain-containing protein [Agromyces sp. SYSU T0242]|uniref:DUF305 domain-containing protein n=1 Tax=Agromyces litoreus TaxID=3158561 RepID=UPI00339A0294